MPDNQEDAVQRLYKYRSLIGDDREYTRQIIVDRKLYYPSPSELNDPCDLMFTLSMDGANTEDYPRATRDDLRAFSEKWLKRDAEENIRIFSLSETNHSELMWSRYADKHSGVCLEFEVPRRLELHEVNYADSRPVFYFADIDKATRINQRYDEAIIAILTTKTDEWTYEREWRCIVFDGENKRRLFPITLSGVIFGRLTSGKDRDDVRAWLDEGKHDVAFYECRMNADNPRLVVLPLDAGRGGNAVRGNRNSLRSLTKHSVPPIIHEVRRSASLPMCSTYESNPMIRIYKRIESETITIPELKPFVGKDVEITVRIKSTTGDSQKDSPSLHGSVLK